MTDSHPKVAIIVLTWNGRADTLACLASLSRVDYANVVVVVVDNGSSDGTEEAVRREFPSVVFHRSETNLGFAGGNIAGHEVARRFDPDYVLLLNNDTEVSPDFLARLVEAAELDSAVGIASPVVFFFDRPKIVWSAGGRFRWLGLHNEMLGHGRADDWIPPVLECEWVTGCAMLLRREAIEKAGFLDALYFAYGEDADLCLRARRAGFRIVTVKASRIWHKVSSATGGAINPVKEYLLARGKSIFIRKLGGRAAQAAFVPLAALETFFFLVLRARQGHWDALRSRVRGYIDGWRRRPVTAEILESQRRRSRPGP